MRILSICKWSAMAGTLAFTTGCLEQSTSAAKKPASGSSAKAYIIKDDAGNLVQGAPKGNATPPAISKNVAPSATLPIHTLQAHEAFQPNHVRGARTYDDFTIEMAGDTKLKIPAAADMNPLWDLGTFVQAPPGLTATDMPKAGPGVFTCSGCHGFNYEGGIFTWNSGATNNLLELRDVRGKTEEDVIAILFNGFNIYDGTKVVNVHNYTTMLSPQAMVDVADFVVNEIFDTHVYIRAPSSQSLGNPDDGTAIYHSKIETLPIVSPIVRVDGNGFNCVSCHGTDGKGTGATAATPSKADLPMLAWKNPFKFMHRSLFGSPRSLAKFNGFTADPTVMPGLYETVFTDGLFFGGPEQGSATLQHIQTLKK